MPIFKCEVKGDDKARIVRADSAAQARAHLVSCTALKTTELADLVEAGATIERAGEMPPEPEADGDDNKPGAENSDGNDGASEAGEAGDPPAGDEPPAGSKRGAK